MARRCVASGKVRRNVYSMKGQCFMLEQDVLARNLTALLPENNQVRSISLTDLVDLTAQYSPQIAL